MINKNSKVYHTTSVDVAKSKHTALSLAGQKRTYRDFQEKQRQTDAHILINTTSTADFHRPTVQQDNSLAPLEAGKVQDILDRGQSVYSQRRDLALTPAVECYPFLDLSHPAYGLPKQLVDNFASIGIKSIYPWQSECLLKSGALRGEKNLVIDNPGKKAILVLPYVALVQEKMRWLRKVIEGIVKKPASPFHHEQRSNSWRKRGDEDSIRVAGFFGGSKSRATWDDMDIAVCTIEKANSLVNTAIDDLSIGRLGVVVMDEMHMIDDESRGYILELIATKLLSLEQGVQIIGMSATLNNAELLAKWLDNAKFYVSRYRPVPIEEYLVFDNVVYPASSTSRFYKTATQLNAQSQKPSQSKPDPSRLITQSSSKELNNALVNAVVALSNETARAGYGALVFCSSRPGCEKDAMLISQVLPSAEEIDSSTAEKRRELLNDLRSTATGLDLILEKTIPTGVAFHHAGLTTEERDTIATAYDHGVIKVIVATCSLAAGINLPARRVILHGARMGADMVGPSMLRQMRGRAGRKGKDEVGETYLCCQKSDLEAVAELMEADIPSVESCLLPGKRGIKRALLEVIAIRLARSNDSIDDYIRRTLLFHSIDHSELAEMVLSTVQELKETGLIEESIGSGYSATPLGQAIVASSLTPEDGLFVHRELRKALGAFVMDGEMHVLYSFTPVQAAHGDINWQIFRKELDRLDESNLRVLEFVGLKPLIINKMAQGGSMKESTAQEIEIALIYRRFYAALQLRDLCNEMPVHAVARKYDISRGIVQNLAQTCHGFAAGMIKFCERMNWGALAAVLDHFSDRLKAGAKSDLLALAKITYIKSRTARIFWENGFKNIAAVAAADVKDIMPVLLLAQPKKPRLSPEDEEKYITKLKGKAEIISKSANHLWEKEMQAELGEEE
ncbi:DEAD/DEAH box helicase [Stipitochalara longipes BDJ]|nr:DEAD/DEAH box helicase [Stipitochalara longipes BDJ]